MSAMNGIHRSHDVALDEHGRLTVQGKAVITEAPRDGRAYARKDAGWLTVAKIVGPRGEPGPPGRDGSDGQDGRQGDPGIAVKGETGPRGERGPPGKDGSDGQDGLRGSIWTTGTGAPTTTTGVLEGDMYLDKTTGDVWRYR
jgi:Collagen triple helix repeat (20 copies)